MSNIKKYDSVAETTADCVTILNSFKKGVWKRKTKFNLNVSFHMGGTHIVRVFSNGKEFATLITREEDTLLCVNMDLSEHKLIIEKINDLSKFYYTHDYENVWYNPYEKKVWVSGGDGGIIYSEEPPKVVAQKMNDGRGWEEGTPDFHEKITELNDSVFEAECDPVDEEGEDDTNYILVGKINDVMNIDCDEEDGETQGMTMDVRERKPSIAELKQQLANAVRNEEYEKAAKLKKEIDKLEKA